MARGRNVVSLRDNGRGIRARAIRCGWRGAARESPFWVGGGGWWVVGGGWWVQYQLTSGVCHTMNARFFVLCSFFFVLWGVELLLRI